MSKFKKFVLSETDMPKQWYNITVDMPNKPLPPLNPITRKPIEPEELEVIFPKALIEQEISSERFTDIPEEVQELYKIWRPTPLVRATGLEKLLDTPAHIYFKNESASPAGSHKLNTAIPQAYYNKKEGKKRIATETGGGQWGSALSFAVKHFEMELLVFMVRSSYMQKPYRKSMMNVWGAEVFPSPGNFTETGKRLLAEYPDAPGSLGIAISEAMEVAAKDPDTSYSLGSVLNHVILHQTVIGTEARKQMEMAGEMPDVVIGCFGGGSNFSGIAFPFLETNFKQNTNIRALAVEPALCPKLTRGEFRYDFGDIEGLTPLLPMFTLGRKFMPADFHAGGLRYHGAGSIVSQLLKDNLIEAVAIAQKETFEAGLMFARSEGIIPAPESSHAIAAAIREALTAKEEGRQKTILFNLSGHGLIDMYAYEQYFAGNLSDSTLSDETIKESIDSSTV